MTTKAEILGQGSTENKVENLADYIAQFGGGDSSHGESDGNMEFNSVALSLVPVPFDQYAGVRKDFFILKNKDGQSVNYFSLIPEALSVDPNSLNQAIKATVCVNIQWQVNLKNIVEFDDPIKWQGLKMQIQLNYGEDKDNGRGDIVDVPLLVSKSGDNNYTIMASHTEVVILPPRIAGMDESQLPPYYLSCFLDWNYTGFQFSDYSNKIMWTDGGISLPDHLPHSEPKFQFSLLDAVITEMTPPDDGPVS